MSPPEELLDELDDELLEDELLELVEELEELEELDDDPAPDEEPEELEDELDELLPPEHTSPVTVGTSALPPFLEP